MVQAMEADELAVAPIETDWNEVQRKYLDGHELASIAADHGTTAQAIATRAWRYHWKAQQFKLMEKNKAEIEREVRGCLTVSVLKEARAFQREDTPSDIELRDIANKTRLRLLETAGKLFGWDIDPIKSAKPVKAIDV